MGKRLGKYTKNNTKCIVPVKIKIENNMKEMTFDEIKMCSQAILDFIDRICQENKITYYLCAGTLLGAVRHNGFIPWDDDIDIMMPREDYERLHDIWKNDGHYKLLNAKNTPHFPYAYSKLIDDRTVKIEPIRKKYQVIGVDVDIFPLDNFPDNEKEALLYLDTIKAFQQKLYNHITPYKRALTFFRTITSTALTLRARAQEFFWGKTAEKIVTQFQRNAQLYNSQQTNYCGITTLYHYGMGERYRKAIFSEVVLVEFENKQYPAPRGYKEYLENMYGDFMQLPSEDKRKTHHSYKAYWK